MKKYLRNSLGRILVILVAAVIEVFVLVSIFVWFYDKAAWIALLLSISGIIITLGIIKNSRHLSYDVVWIVLILLFPISGAIVYLFLGADLFISRTFKKIKMWTELAYRYYPRDNGILEKAKEEYPEARGQFEYICKNTGFSFYKNRELKYYGLGELGFPKMLEELKKAERFIFLEYFIIDEGEMWNSILKILEEKARQGVDVRVIYDDLGSFFLLPVNYYKTLEEKGIKCVPFNRINPILNIIINHRDHRKIMVIDGKVAFSGGINLADEYINKIHPYGHWKDNVIMIKGEAVWSYTVMFLTHFNALKPIDTDFTVFKVRTGSRKQDGYIAPYGETPLDDEMSSQNIYLNILNGAKDYCYIFTPYLIIDTEMINTLILTAKRGVDVCLVTPGIPDKKIVYAITRSYYRQLIEGGVKIIEYTPGFIHSKVFVADDIVATVGTINLDYRSLYLHFENGTYIYGSKVIKEIRDDLLDAMAKGHEVTLEESARPFIYELIMSFLRLFAPLM
ncbi:MAG: cardiolipin synthase [Erysipelotrichaceae bacterium]|nr:cardiolipin synthase [Erysipelotrichaceae bacterium]